MSFSALGLSAPLLRAIEDLGFDAPTPVQNAVIPAVLDGRDVWASAKTGSGKTAAFVLPMLERHRRGQLALVLAPTRELAAQIADEVHVFSLHWKTPLKTVLAIGGVSINPQMMELRGGADIVVGTPGRILDLVDHNALKLANVELLVLDEADRLLSLGFADELARVIALLPRSQRLLFSATFPPAVSALAEGLLDNPMRVAIDAGAPLAEIQANIVQRAIEVDPSRRTMLLRHLLETRAWPRVLVFVASRYSAEHVTDKLRRAKISAAPFHGEQSQGARTESLAGFEAGRIRVLVATDLAARGLDITALPAVVNYDLPRSPVDYVHRIGRTGRAGEAGEAVSFIGVNDEAHFRVIEKRHRLSIERERIPELERVEVADPQAATGTGGKKGKRKSKKDKAREAAKRE